LPSLRRFSTRDEQKTYNAGGFVKEENNNGLSFLELEADELIAEDDLFWDTYQEKQAKTKHEQKEMAEMESRRKEVVRANKKHSLQALVWWISQGGIFPSSWSVPTKDEIKKLGANGMEKMLNDIAPGVVGEEIFEEGWTGAAEDTYRVVVFSKVSLALSNRPKNGEC
jgi:hypothetical protein